ncbi:hypothetical protein BGZ98_006359 [Dissophora globulifera]|nr:hypothetical protein BGZ98_006359 [Dissophora globulifera]
MSDSKLIDWNTEREVLEARKKHRALDDREKKEDWTLLLCLWCRRRVFEIFPEPFPLGVVGNYLTKKQLMAKYPIGKNMVKNIDDRRDRGQHSEADALRKLRWRFGGDVGIDAWGESDGDFCYRVRKRIDDAMVASLPMLLRETQVLQLDGDKDTL